MKKYFVTTDVHGYYDIFIDTLHKNGFDFGNPDHIIIICGDLFDRGKQAKYLLEWLLLLPEDRLILIKGNHEDLMEDCLEQLKDKSDISLHHIANGTLDTVSQLTDINIYDLIGGIYNYNEIESKMKDYFKLVDRSVDYYKLGNYIFVHGWVPVVFIDSYDISGELSAIMTPIIKLDADKKQWQSARWDNGMKMADLGAIVNGKTIVCGHYHTGWGHKNILKTCTDDFECFDIYRNKGIIALDSCVAYSKQLNMLVIESN